MAIVQQSRVDDWTVLVLPSRIDCSGRWHLHQVIKFIFNEITKVSSTVIRLENCQGPGIIKKICNFTMPIFQLYGWEQLQKASAGVITLSVQTKHRLLDKSPRRSGQLRVFEAEDKAWLNADVYSLDDRSNFIEQSTLDYGEDCVCIIRVQDDHMWLHLSTVPPHQISGSVWRYHSTWNTC